ncbi:HAD family hydrolase [Streptomyces acidiscabies]|uniref:HAD family hydrolase n=1 Tax=Streptomyces acidiscabies TaxID=42234 RepID=UPI000951E208|nr:HAD family phosphatase [Streptomyces acidiscabies]
MTDASSETARLPAVGQGVRAVVFDCDGTLVDTHACLKDAVRALFAGRRRRCDPSVHASVTGLAISGQAALLADILGEPAGMIADELLTALMDAVPRVAQPMPGALELLHTTAARLPVAIASNSDRALLRLTLAHGGMTGVAQVTVAADEVAAPKPAPDLYLAACAALGVRPEDALAVEDSPTGARAARAAGMPVLGVGSGVSAALVHWWVPDLTRIHLYATPLARC